MKFAEKRTIHLRPLCVFVENALVLFYQKILGPPFRPPGPDSAMQKALPCVVRTHSAVHQWHGRCSQAERRSTSFVLLCNMKKGGLCTIVVTELSTLTSSSRLVTTTPSSGLFHQEPRHTPYSVSIQAIHILISHYSLHRVLLQEVAFIDRYTNY